MDRPDDLLTLGISPAYRAALSKKFSVRSLNDAEQEEQQQHFQRIQDGDIFSIEDDATDEDAEPLPNPQTTLAEPGWKDRGYDEYLHQRRVTEQNACKASNLQGEMNLTEHQARLALQATDSQNSAWHRSMDLQAESTRMLLDMQKKLAEQEMETQANRVQHLDAMLKAERIQASATENDLRAEIRRQSEQLKTLGEEKELLEMAHQQEISAHAQTSEHLSEAKEKLAFFRLVSAVRARQIVRKNGLIKMGIATVTRKRAECDGLYEAIEEFREQNLMLAMT